MKKFVQLSLGLLLTEAIKQSDIDLGDASGEINEELMPVKDVDQTPLESIATLNSITSNKDQDTQSLAANEAHETHKVEAAHKIAAEHKQAVEHKTASKNFPESTINIKDNFDLNKTSEQYAFGPYTKLTTDARDKTGEMHFTKDQVEAIQLFRRTQSYDNMANGYVRRKIKIMNMDMMRRTGLGKNEAHKILPDYYPRKNMHKHLTVHMVAHTHDDVGWQKTYEEYYSGMEQNICHARVEQIITEVIFELEREPTRKFTYVEMKFLNMWYVRATKERQEALKKLIKEGRFEIVMGGWVHTDECDANYEDIVNNMVEGHQWLSKEFGVSPRIGWNIDAFGHTQTNAALFHDMGFEAQFFARGQRDDMNNRFKADVHGSHFLWRPLSKHFGAQKEILSAFIATTETYGYPGGFKVDEHFDVDGPIQNDPTLADFNGDQRIIQMVNHIHAQANGTSSDSNVMVLYGDDFTHANAYMSFHEMDQIIEMINKESDKYNMTVISSTPGAYVDALKAESVKWPVRYDDILNYFEDKWSFWSGYYSSRPTFKKMITDASHNFHSQSKLYARKMLDQSLDEKDLKEYLDASATLLDELSVNQHHDAITGTAAQYVTFDYEFKLQGAQDKSVIPFKKAVKDQLEHVGFKTETKNVLQCVGQQNHTVVDCPVDAFSKQDFIVAVQNQQIKANDGLIRILLPHSNYTAEVWDQAALKWVDTVFDIVEQKHFDKNFDPFGKVDYILFMKAEVQADEIFYVKVKFAGAPHKLSQNLAQTTDAKSSSLQITGFSEGGEVLFQYVNPSQEIDQTFGVSLKYYHGHVQREKEFNKMYVGSQSEEEIADRKEADGVYIFRPEWRDPLPHQYSKLVEDVIFQKGNLVEMWTVIFNDPNTNEQAIIKVLSSPALGEIIEFDVEMNTIPIDDAKAKDVTVNWKMYNGFNANKTFWTDSNAMEMQERNIYALSRPEHTVPGNYYPVTSAIAMRDIQSNLQVTILNDRPQGGSADLLLNNTIELMQMRRLLGDDGKGIGEALNETDSYDDLGIQVSVKYHMQIFDRVKGKSLQRNEQIKFSQPLDYFFIFNLAPTEVKPKTATKQVLLSDSFSSQGTYRLIPFAKDQVMVRFQNLADRFDSHSNETSFINLKEFADNLFEDVNAGTKPQSVVIEEVSLQGNQLLGDLVKHTPKWEATEDGSNLPFSKAPEDKNGFEGIALEPQRLRSFIVSYNGAEKDGQNAQFKMNLIQRLIKKSTTIKITK